jgi:hypothetical protein
VFWGRNRPASARHRASTVRRLHTNVCSALVSSPLILVTVPIPPPEPASRKAVRTVVRSLLHLSDMGLY